MKQGLNSLLALGALATTLLVSGCGGGGSGSGGSGNLTVFATDNLSANYSGVWVRIHEVELDSVSTGGVTVFRSDAGVEINLRALNNGQPLYQALGSINIPNGNYTGARVTVGKSLVLFATGSTSGTNATFIDSLDAGTGKSRIPINFATPLAVGGNTNLTLDFDLANWNLAAGKVTPVVSKGNNQGIDDSNRHVVSPLKGTISGLSGTTPLLSFTLTLPGGETLAVRTDTSTVLLREDANGNPSLANGTRVEVTGKFNPTTRQVTAQVIKIEDGVDDQKVKGKVVQIDAANSKVKVEAALVRGFLPTETQVFVQANNTTRLLLANGSPVSKADFFAALAAAGNQVRVEAEGTYDASSKILTAKAIKIENENFQAEQEVKGIAQPIASGDRRVLLTVTEWEGFSFTPGQTLAVTSTSNTLYKNADGNSITDIQFWGSVAAGVAVKAEGVLGNNGLTATKMKILYTQPGGGNDPHEAEGTIRTINSGAGTFQINLIDWFGFSGTFNAVVNVEMSPNSTYKDRQGNAMTKQQFFAALGSNVVVELDGRFDGTTFTALKAKLED